MFQALKLDVEDQAKAWEGHLRRTGTSTTRSPGGQLASEGRPCWDIERSPTQTQGSISPLAFCADALFAKCFVSRYC